MDIYGCTLGQALVQLAGLTLAAFKDLRVTLVHRVFKDRLVPMALKVFKDPRVILVHRVFKVRRAFKAPRVTLARRVFQAQLGHRVLPAPQV
jgi:hypothetical protein